jgi:hypothetical protein
MDADADAKVYANIPDTRAIHVSGSAENELAHGDLSLVRMTRDTLALSVGSAAFALDRATPFGTISGDVNTYVFQPSGVPGFVPPPTLSGTLLIIDCRHVKLVLPPDATGEQDKFESALIRFGLLKSGLSAHTDELARSAEESALAASTRVTTAADAYVHAQPATTHPVAIDPSWHAAVDDAAQRVHDAADTTGAAADGVGARVKEGGAWLAQKTAPAAERPQVARAATSLSGEPAPAPLSMRTAAEEYTTVAAALSTSVSALSGAAGAAVSQIVNHDFGPDAAKLVDGLGRGAMGAGRVVGDVGKATSVGWFAGQGALGALEERDPKVARQVAEEGKDMESKQEVEEDGRN